MYRGLLPDDSLLHQRERPVWGVATPVLRQSARPWRLPVHSAAATLRFRKPGYSNATGERRQGRLPACGYWLASAQPRPPGHRLTTSATAPRLLPDPPAARATALPFRPPAHPPSPTARAAAGPAVSVPAGSWWLPAFPPLPGWAGAAPARVRPGHHHWPL